MKRLVDTVFPRNLYDVDLARSCRRAAEIFAESVHRQMAMAAEPLRLTQAALYSLKDYLDKGSDEMQRHIVNAVEQNARLKRKPPHQPPIRKPKPSKKRKRP